MTDWSKLSDRELDAKCAEFRGWVPPPEYCHAWQRRDRCFPWERYDFDSVGNKIILETTTDEEFKRRFCWRKPDGRYTDLMSGDTPVPVSTDLNAARELEKEIERRGIRARSLYIDALLRTTGCNMAQPEFHVDELFALARATARQRAEAFCEVMEAARLAGGEKEHTNVPA